VVPFYKGKKDTVQESGTVLDHLTRSLAFTKANTGKHGLPLLGFADWNDTVNLPTGAESIFNACLYGRALQEMIDLAKKLGKNDWVGQYGSDYEAMKKVSTKMHGMVNGTYDTIRLKGPLWVQTATNTERSILMHNPGRFSRVLLP
jgi:cellobiose phosphorylase